MHFDSGCNPAMVSRKLVEVIEHYKYVYTHFAIRIRRYQISSAERHGKKVGLHRLLKPRQKLVWRELRDSNGFNTRRALFEEVPL